MRRGVELLDDHQDVGGSRDGVGGEGDGGEIIKRCYKRRRIDENAIK